MFVLIIFSIPDLLCKPPGFSKEITFGKESDIDDEGKEDFQGVVFCYHYIKSYNFGKFPVLSYIFRPNLQLNVKVL